MKKFYSDNKKLTLVKLVILICVGLLGLIFILMPPERRIQGQTNGCPNIPVVNISSSEVPKDVCIPDGFAGNPIDFFDDFSWRSFMAITWTAQNGQRGMPDNSKTVASSGPRVFETYKTQWEVFHSDGSQPVEWNKYDSTNACGKTLAFGDMVLASFSKFSDLGQAGFGTLVGPLVAQNKTYVRYETGFNQIEFDQIFQNQWYLRSKLPAPGQSITFNNNALDVKSAWIDMTNVPHPERYYTRSAWIMDLETEPVQCSQKTVGLVGLHIVQKTASRPQWIWTTFEQIDNVPPAQTGAFGRFNFNDGTITSMPASNPFPIDPPIVPPPTPFNVQRLKSIDTRTQNTNTKYQQSLKAAGSVWQFYQLVMTQWPLVPNSPNTPGSPPNTFPGTGATTAFSNTTMETFEQASVTTSCMACHNFTKQQTDFLWVLRDHAFPANVPGLLFKDKAFKELQNLLQNTQQMNKLELQLLEKKKLQTSHPKKKSK